jgi:hypothetical protein
MAPGSPLRGICISRVHFPPTATPLRESIAGISPKRCRSSPLGSLPSTTSTAPSVETRMSAFFDCSARRLKSASDRADEGFIVTESVIVCISVPLAVNCFAIARV